MVPHIWDVLAAGVTLDITILHLAGMARLIMRSKPWLLIVSSDYDNLATAIYYTYLGLPIFRYIMIR